MSDESRYLLVLQIEAVEHLLSVFGEVTVAASLEDVGNAFAGVAGRLLARHEFCEFPPSDAPGRWWRAFRFAPSGLPGDRQEQRETVVTTGRMLVREALKEVFGAASGSRIGFRLSVVELEETQDPDGWIDRHMADCPCCWNAGLPVERLELERLITGAGNLRTLLQPIVSFPDGRIVGYEALSRGPVGHTLERADLLFGTANQHGLGPTLESVCAEQALSATRHIPLPFWVSINLGARTIMDRGLVGHLAQPGVVVELTEHLPLEEARLLPPMLADLRDKGLRIALDDTGCGFADPEVAETLRPDIVKLCITVIRNAGKGQAFVDDIARATERFRELGAEVLAEGVETEEQAAALANTGITLAQGWLYGRPVPASSVLL